MTHEELMVLLTGGVQHGASDIHFKAGDPPSYRINGALIPARYDRLKPAATEAICKHLMRASDLEESIDQLQECDTSFSIPGVSRFRVNIYRQRGSLAAVLRIIPSK